MTLTDRVAIVTGAGHGIGAAIVERLLADGARVVAADLPRVLEGRVDEPRLVFCGADVTSPADAERIAAVAVERFGAIDIVVNNAGVMDRFLPLGELTDDVWSRVMAVNLTGPMLVTRAALPKLLAAKGVVVNISSVGGIGGGRAGAAYTASKHGLIGLTRNVAVTYAKDGLRCVAVAPGGVNTGIPLGGEPSARGYETLQKTLATMVRMAEPVELANLVAFLVSPDASFMNGAVVVADGGWTAF